MTGRVKVRKMGPRSYPWLVRCLECREERLHLTAHGVVVVNDRGVGNRTWPLALLAAAAHVGWHRAGARP